MRIFKGAKWGWAGYSGENNVIIMMMIRLRRGCKKRIMIKNDNGDVDVNSLESWEGNK